MPYENLGTKEKISGTPTQKRFDEVVAMQKDYF